MAPHQGTARLRHPIRVLDGNICIELIECWTVAGRVEVVFLKIIITIRNLSKEQ